MPADLSKEAMVNYIKNTLLEFDHIRGPSIRAVKANDLFTYILTYFKHFIDNFKLNMKFLDVVRRKCIDFVNDGQAVQFEYLVHTSLTLLEKMNQAISEIQKNQKIECNCQGCQLRKNQHVQHAELVGLVG